MSCGLHISLCSKKILTNFDAPKNQLAHENNCIKRPSHLQLDVPVLRQCCNTDTTTLRHYDTATLQHDTTTLTMLMMEAIFACFWIWFFWSCWTWGFGLWALRLKKLLQKNCSQKKLLQKKIALRKNCPRKKIKW